LSNSHHLSLAVKQKALELGFDACGIAQAGALTTQQPILSEWLANGYHAKMSYMAGHFDKRIDPCQLVPGAKSIVAVALNYFPAASQPDGTTYKIARYAYGRDYHVVIKEKLERLAEALSEIAGPHQYRAFTDSAPVLERSWAQAAGLGNHGKNTCLILPRKGSYYFLGELITSIALAPDEAFEKDLCGKCAQCIDACPTGAIKGPGIIDAGKCISYLTIELKDKMPEQFHGKCEGWIFGCDRCQEVCPHNKHASKHNEKAFEPLPPITDWKNSQWESMTKADFRLHFKKTNSPIARVKYEKLMDNIRIAGAMNQ
jgi:epoxyqueuosine reductase